MTNHEIPKNCPNCRNHCPINALRCVKGRQWKMVEMRKLKESYLSKVASSKQ